MTFKVGDRVEFNYMDKKVIRAVRSIGEDGTMYVDIYPDGSLSWAVHPSTARLVGAEAEDETEEGNTEELNNFRMGPPEESAEDPPTTKYVDLDTYAKIATVVIFGGLILGHM